MFGKQKQPQIDGCILDYAYETVDDEIVNTYVIGQNEDTIYRVFYHRYYLCVLGDKTYSKLESRGFIPLEEAYIKYEVSEIPIIVGSIEQKGGFMKTFLKRGQH